MLRNNIFSDPLGIKHEQSTLSTQNVFGLKHFRSNYAEQVCYAYAPNMFDTAVQGNKTSSIKHENKINVLSCLIECFMAFKFYQTRPNRIKQHQTRWPNCEMFGHQTMFVGVIAKHFPFGQAFRVFKTQCKQEPLCKA